MKKRIGVLLFIAGMIVGGTLVRFVMTPAPSERYVFHADVNLEQLYFFGPEYPSPIRGEIKRGSEFEVQGRHSSADYIVLRTVVDHDKLMTVAHSAAASHSAPKSRPR